MGRARARGGGAGGKGNLRRGQFRRGGAMPMQRTGTMSTKHELLKQIRDSVNPAQTLENPKHTTEKLDESMATTLALMQEMSAGLNTTQSFLGYLNVLPEMVSGMENMATNIGISTDTMGCSAIFGGNSKPECQA